MVTVLTGAAVGIVLMALVFAALTLVNAAKNGVTNRETTTNIKTVTIKDTVTAPKYSASGVTPNGVTALPPRPVPVEAPVIPPGPVFETRNLHINPTIIKEGEEVKINLDVINIGQAHGCYVAELKVNGEIVSRKEAILAPWESRVIPFIVKGEEAGDYRVEVGALIGKFSVPPAKFVVSSLAVEPSVVKENETVNVTFDINNTGHARGTYRANIRVNGKVTVSKEISLPVGGAETARFSVSADRAGEYRVEVEGLTGAFSVPEARFEIAELTVEPDMVSENEPVTVFFSVSNTGHATGVYEALLKVNGITVQKQEIKLAPDANTRVEFQFSDKKPGEHRVEVGELAGWFSIPPADVVVSNLKVSPERATERDKILVTADIANRGGVTATYDAILKLKGSPTGKETVVVAPGTQGAITFTLAKLRPGFYNVEVGDLSHKLVVSMADHFETF